MNDVDTRPRVRRTGHVLVASAATVLAALYALRYALGSALRSVVDVVLPGDVWVAIKGLSVVLLAWVCLRAGRRAAGRGPLVVGIALGFHAVGDVLIARGALLPAMAFFLLGHVGYIVAFARAGTEPGGAVLGGISRARLGVALALAGWGVWMVGRLMPAMSPPFTFAIPIYSLALLGMACSAVLIARADAATVVAALLYVFSDSVIAWDEFLGLAPGAEVLGWTTWPTYFLAQLLFVRWALQDTARPAAR